MFSSLSSEIILGILFFVSFLLMFLGLPVSFSFGGTAFVILALLMGPTGVYIVANRIWGLVDMFVVITVPLFVFMGMMLEASGISTQLYSTMNYLIGGIRGGLASGTVIACTLIAAMTGLSGTGVLIMGVIALPEMLKRGYHKTIALGSIMAGSALGPLIPPSVSLIFYGIIAQQSIGKLFAGGLIPGLILSATFVAYITIASYLKPNLAPAATNQERVTLKIKMASLRNVILPLIIIVAVLGSIYMGVATPTEAAGVGALGALVCAAINRQLNKRIITDTCFKTAIICGMVMWILVATYTIQTIVFQTDAVKAIEQLFLSLPGGRWGALVAMQIVWFILGCLMNRQELPAVSAAGMNCPKRRIACNIMAACQIT